ncbi:MAG: tyrosine--tRNA ligase [Armatimonadota bacterium]
MFEHLVGDASEVHSPEELLEKLKLDRPLRVKYGADPTAPDLHLGHSVPMMRLRRFQEAGHRVVFIIGDFTARIGDPSGRTKTRPMLSREEIERNAETFARQAGKILDIDACEIRYNSEWLEDLGSDGMIRLSSHYTVARMLERDDFRKRLETESPISIREFLYPLVQAYDSVAVEADVEVGGSDQLFNFLVGRDIMRAYGMQPQVAATWTLLVGTDGTEKMSKSLGNYVGVTEPPEEMFVKLMSIPDDVLPHYWALLTDEGFESAERIDEEMLEGERHPMDVKKDLARRVVARYHDEAAAEAAQAEFEQVFSRGEKPSEMDELPVEACDIEDGRVWIVKLVRGCGAASSNSEARRLVDQGAVRLNDEKVTDQTANVEVHSGDILQVGKHTFAKVKLI